MDLKARTEAPKKRGRPRKVDVEASAGKMSTSVQSLTIPVKDVQASALKTKPVKKVKNAVSRVSATKTVQTGSEKAKATKSESKARQKVVPQQQTGSKIIDALGDQWIKAPSKIAASQTPDLDLEVLHGSVPSSTSEHTSIESSLEEPKTNRSTYLFDLPAIYRPVRDRSDFDSGTFLASRDSREAEGARVVSTQSLRKAPSATPAHTPKLPLESSSSNYRPSTSVTETKAATSNLNNTIASNMGEKAEHTPRRAPPRPYVSGTPKPGSATASTANPLPGLGKHLTYKGASRR